MSLGSKVAFVSAITFSVSIISYVHRSQKEDQAVRYHNAVVHDLLVNIRYTITSRGRGPAMPTASFVPLTSTIENF